MLHWRKSILHSADVYIKYFCSTDWRTSSFLHKPLIDFWSCYLPTMTSWPPFYTGFCLDLLGGPVCGPWWSEPRGAQGSFIFIMRGGLPNLTTLCSCVCFMEDTRRLIFTPQRRFIYLWTLTRYLKVFHCEINLWLQTKQKPNPQTWRSADGAFIRLTAWEKKLLCSPVVQRILLYFCLMAEGFHNFIVKLFS